MHTEYETGLQSLPFQMLVPKNVINYTKKVK